MTGPTNYLKYILWTVYVTWKYESWKYKSWKSRATNQVWGWKDGMMEARVVVLNLRWHMYLFIFHRSRIGKDPLSSTGAIICKASFSGLVYKSPVISGHPFKVVWRLFLKKRVEHCSLTEELHPLEWGLKVSKTSLGIPDAKSNETCHGHGLCGQVREIHDCL